MHGLYACIIPLLKFGYVKVIFRLICDPTGQNEKYNVWAWLKYAVAHAHN